MSLRPIIACLVAAFIAGPEMAQSQPSAAMGDSAKALLGAWEFSNADRDKRCTAGTFL